MFANSIYLIASDEDSLVQNSGTIATLPLSAQGDNGFYIDINGRLSIATKLDEVNEVRQVNQANEINQTTKENHNIAQAIHTSQATHNSDIDSSPPRNTQSTTTHNATNTITNTTSNANATYNANTTAPFASTLASLYASSNLSISAKSITNTHSTIYAGDTLSINTDTLKNTQGSIYASSALAIYANTIDNIGIASTKTHLQSKQYITQGNLKQVGDKHFWRSVYVDRLDSFSSSIIASSGDTYILAHTLRNHNSYISASNSLNIQARNASNTQTQAYKKVVDNGVEVRNYQYTYWENYAGVKGVFCGIFTFGICNIRERHTATAQGVFTYAPPHTISKIKLDFPTLDSQLEPNITRLNTSIANKISSTSEINNANALFSTSSSAFDNARYDDRESFARSSYFYQQFASRDSSQAKVFLANLDLESKAIFYNSSAFLSNALDTQSLSDSQAKHLTSLALHQHYHNNQYSQPYNSSNTLKHTQYIYGNTSNNTHNNTANNPHNNLTHSLKSSDSTRHNLSFLAHSIGFSGDLIAIDSHTFSNDSTLQGGKVDLHTSEALAHLGDIKAKDITLQSDGTLYIGGGDIQARDKAYLQARHISIDSLITASKGYTPTTHANNANYLNHIIHTNHANYASLTNYANQSSQLSTRFAPFHSMDSITATSTLKAGSLFLHAKDSAFIASANLSADDSISIYSSALDLSTQAINSAYKDSYQTHKDTTHIGTTLSANSISLSTKDSLRLINATLQAGEDISLHSSGNISLDSATDTHYATSTHHSTKQNLFYSKDTTTTTTTQRGSVLKASAISLNAQDSILSKGTNYYASTNLSLNATNNYIESALSHSTSTDATTSTSDNALGFIPINTKDTHTFAKNTTHTNSALNSSSITINAKNATLLGVDIHSQDEVSISTDNFSLANVQDSHYLSTSSKSKRMFGLKNSEQKDTLSQSIAHKSTLTSKNLILHSDNDINIIASDIATSNNASLISKGDINIHNAYSTTTTTHYEKQTDFSQAITQGLKAALTGGISLLKDTKCNGGKCSLHTTIADYKEGTSSTYAKEVISSNLNIGNNLVISNASSSNNALANDNTPISNGESASNNSSAPNISILGSSLQANNISLDSANDIVIASAKNSYSTSQSRTQGSISTTLSVGNAYVDAGYAGYGVYEASSSLAKASKNYEHIKSLHKQGKASSAALEDAKLNVVLATANLTTSMINLTNATASAATAATTGYGTGMYVSAGLSLAGSKQSTDSASTIHTASSLSASNDISLNAINSITQAGSHLLADNSIAYVANNDITIQSSEDTYSSKSSYKDFSTSIEYGTNGFGMQASYSQDNSKANSISQNNSTSYAKHITLNTDKSLNIISSNVESNTLEVNANSLKIESKYSSQYAKGNGVATSLGYGANNASTSSQHISPLSKLSKNAKSLNFSLGINSSNTDKEWIQTQASLLSQGSATINIQGNTHLAGGILSSKQEKLSLNTHSLTHSHLSSKDYNDSKAFSLSLSASDTELNLHNQGHKKEGIAYATLGYGHININAPNTTNSINDTNVINSTSTPKTINTENVANTLDSLSTSAIENISTSTLDTLNTTNTPITLSNNNEAILSSVNIPSNTNPTNTTINLADKANTPNALDTTNTPNTRPTPHKSLSGLNRDLSRSITTTKDTQTNALDSSLSIDNRIFSTSGRDDIASDIKNFRDNTIKAGIGATLTAINPLLSTYQILHSKSNPNNDEQISFSDSLNQWKSNQTTMVNTLNLSNANNRNILNNLANKDNPQSLQSIHNALNPSDSINLNFYYDERDEALGFFNKNSKDKYTKEIYLNTAKGVANDTHTLINTYNHEITHSYTSNETIANNAGKLGNFLYNTINTLNGDKIYASKNNSNPNISNNLTHKSISKVVNNITPISQATSQNALEDNNFGDLDLANPQYLTPKSWLASQSKESISILQSNTYNASLIDSVDRDNALPLVPIIAAITRYFVAKKIQNGTKKLVNLWLIKM